ncbi:hypothetical protein [Rhizobium herbae]|uniref:Uncharacterized protein n=1 Tax=Rhizobium herbae TaxID=508661 RepID=A0ABS4EG65_9HYPH|nr:hypothetical protein [Rhizobium herbae]MBP1856930.1 hypothetical protein [Rhizobium herbae]
MQQLASFQSAGKDARATTDRASLSGAVIRLAAVFSLAGTVQLLAGWLLR